MFSVRLSNHRANAKNKEFLATAILSGKTLGERKGFSVELDNSKKARWERNLSDIMIQYGCLRYWRLSILINLPSMRNFIRFKSGGSLAIFLLALLLPFVISAKQLTVSPLPLSPYVDTVITTNIVFNNHRSDVKELELKFVLECSSSNCIQVAFGNDANADGVLSRRETVAIYGWRNGRYFAEDVMSGKRYDHLINEEEINSPQTFTVNLRTTKDYLPKSFSAQVNGISILTNLSNTLPDWLYRPEWNLMRITRRGMGVPNEWIACDIDYARFYMIVR